MKSERHSIYPFIRLAIIFMLLLNTSMLMAQRQERSIKVKVKARHYLFLKDTVYYCDSNTVFFIPESEPYKVRRYPTPFMKRKYPAMLWKELYREHPSNPEKEDTIYNIKSESPYTQYQGRQIAGMVITRVNAFGGSMHDTLYVEESRIDRWAAKIHINTLSWVIWNNLFIKHDTIVDQYRLADNERVLRSLFYMHDARIYVKDIEGSDKVFIEVITQDVWTIGVTAFFRTAEEVEARIYDRNFLGMGQSVTFTTRYNYTTHPETALSLSYQKDNLLGTFFNPGFRISTMNNGVQQGEEYEGNTTVFVGRPLFTPVVRVAGNVEFSYNWSINRKDKVDSLFYQYAYTRLDVWAGYTFEQFFRKKRKWVNSERYRFMVSARVISQHFTDKPDQEKLKDNYLYNDQQGYIGQVSWFHYNYYKTRYLLGFGRTEDVPYGYNLSINAGVQRILNEVRPYTGGQISYIIIAPKGQLLISNLYLSSFYNKGIEDGLLAYTGSLYSRIRRVGTSKFRNFVSVGYAVIYHQRFDRGLTINNQKGIIGLNSNLSGTQTIFARYIATVYPNFKMVGFRFAFFMSLSLAQLAGGSDKFLLDNRVYTGVGAGFRTRNENLVFDEVEVTFNYFPIVPAGANVFALTITTNPKLVFDMGSVRAPSFVVY